MTGPNSNWRADKQRKRLGRELVNDVYQFDKRTQSKAEQRNILAEAVRNTIKPSDRDRKPMKAAEAAE